MSVCLRNSLCMQSHCFVFLEALFMAKCFIFLNKKIYYFYETHKKKHMKDALSSQKKNAQMILFFWMHFQLEKGRRRTIRNLGQPTMNILTTILVREWKASFFCRLFSYLPCYFKTFRSNHKQNTTTHISCKRRQQSALLLWENRTTAYPVIFPLKLSVFVKKTTTKKTQKNIILFYLLQIPLWKNLFAGLWHLLWLETDNKFAVFTGKRNNDVNSYKFASFANCIQLSGIYGCKVGWILGEKFTLNQSNNTKFQHDEQIFFVGCVLLLAKLRSMREYACLLNYMEN